MTPASRRNRRRGSGAGRSADGRGDAGRGEAQRPASFWRPPGEPARPEAIRPAAEPTALVRSLGRPPLDHPGADEYLAAVVERASALATALATAAGIVATDER